MSWAANHIMRSASRAGQGIYSGSCFKAMLNPTNAPTNAPATAPMSASLVVFCGTGINGNAKRAAKVPPTSPNIAPAIVYRVFTGELFAVYARIFPLATTMATMVAGHPRRAAEKQINERAFVAINRPAVTGLKTVRGASRAGQGRAGILWGTIRIGVPKRARFFSFSEVSLPLQSKEIA